MKKVPVFDSLTHPTISGDWLLPGYKGKSSLKLLLQELDKQNIVKALAVGMKGIGCYKEEKYAGFINSNSDILIPVAFCDVNSLKNTAECGKYLKKLKRFGYKGIKLHPRLGNFTLKNKFLPIIIKLANDNGLPVLLCTYFYSDREGSHSNNSESLVSMMEQIPEEKLILTHAGAVNLMNYIEIARAFKNVLLDLSFTLVKYAGSSLDLDIKYAFENFDSRICIGSDFPEISIETMKNRFNLFSGKISTGKTENIAFKNLNSFFNV